MKLRFLTPFMLALAMTAQAPSKVQMLGPWENLEGQDASRFNGDWLAIVGDDEGNRFAHAQVKIVGGEVRIDGVDPRKVLMLLRGFELPVVKPEVSIPLIEILSPENADVGRSIGWKGSFEGKSFTVQERYPEGWTPKGSLVNKAFTVTFRQDGKGWPLFKLDGTCPDCGWEILWAGDLDGDGKLDLVTEHSPAYLSSLVQIWLSSKAKPGHALGLAASHMSASD